MTVAPVVPLLKRGSPADVARLVVPVVVDAIDRVLTGRTRTDVLKERLKRLAPFVTYTNTATAVVLVAGGVWIAAAVFHQRPDSVLSGACHAVGSPAGLGPVGSEVVRPVAAARLRATLPQFVLPHEAFGTAVAAADPYAVMLGAFAFVRDNEAAESSPDEIELSWSQKRAPRAGQRAEASRRAAPSRRGEWLTAAFAVAVNDGVRHRRIIPFEEGLESRALTFFLARPAS